MEQIIEIASIEQYCKLFGQHYLHSGVGIIQNGTPLGALTLKGNFYAVYLRRTWCGNTRYGCGCHDFTTATMVFKAPGEVSNCWLTNSFRMFRLPEFCLLRSCWTRLCSTTSGRNILFSTTGRMNRCICQSASYK